MKIIANSGRDRFIVEMLAHEIHQLAGKGYCSDRIDIGDQVNVDKAWADLRKFREAATKLAQAAEVLRACAQLSETAAANYLLKAPSEATE